MDNQTLTVLSGVLFVLVVSRPSVAGELEPDHGVSATFSIVAVDPETGVCGAAVASRFPGVGRIVPYVRADVGAFCTQLWHHPPWGEKALDLLAEGNGPEEVLGMLLQDDVRRDKRQLAIIDMQGRAANRNPSDADPSGIYWGAHPTDAETSVESAARCVAAHRIGNAEHLLTIADRPDSFGRIHDRTYLLSILVLGELHIACSAETISWNASGTGGAVAAGRRPEAVAAGLEILRDVGNASDAAAATLLALSVTDYGSFAERQSLCCREREAGTFECCSKGGLLALDVSSIGHRS